MMRLRPSLFIAACLVIVGSRPAHAYIDLGTGSYLFQLLLAGILGALFALKMYWRSAKNALRNLFSKNRNARKRREK